MTDIALPDPIEYTDPKQGPMYTVEKAGDGRYLFEISTIKITRKRFRDPGDVSTLADSITRLGQLQPIILEENGELVAGLRRLTATKALGKTQIWGVFKGNIDEITAREIELEENIRRLDMTWLQKAQAIAEIDRLKRIQDPNWSRDMTAAVAGTNRASDVSDAVKITKLMEIFPELKDAKSMLQARSWALAKVASVTRVKEVKDNPAEFAEIESKIILGDSVEIIKQIPDGQFRAIITDPPFGIGYDLRKAGTEQAPTAYQDDEKSYERLLSMAPDLYRVLQPDGWLIWFLGPTWYERAKIAFRAAGFTVDEMPVIWDRSGGRGYTARPDRYFTRVYDMALHCLKGNPELTAYGRGKPNIIAVDPVPGDEKDLLVERPVELYAELIKRLTFEGEKVADFFAGSGSCPAAAVSLKRDYFAVELSPERRAVAIKKTKGHTPDEH